MDGWMECPGLWSGNLPSREECRYAAATDCALQSSFTSGKTEDDGLFLNVFFGWGTDCMNFLYGKGHKAFLDLFFYLLVGQVYNPPALGIQVSVIS